jgi:acylphosphatase
MHKGLRIIVSGVVQGVGFRYYVKRLADRFGAKGFVRNLPSGDVEIYAEAEDRLLNGFLGEIRIGPSHAHVSNIKIEWLEYKGTFNEFGIEL